MLAVTGWREPISISGAGKVVDGILRQRPCFFRVRPVTRLFADVDATVSPSGGRHHALAHDVAAAITTVVVAGPVIVGVAVIGVSVAVVAAVEAGAGNSRPDGDARPEAAAMPVAAMAPAASTVPTATAVEAA